MVVEIINLEMLNPCAGAGTDRSDDENDDLLMALAEEISPRLSSPEAGRMGEEAYMSADQELVTNWDSGDFDSDNDSAGSLKHPGRDTTSLVDFAFPPMTKFQAIEDSFFDAVEDFEEDTDTVIKHRKTLIIA